MSFILGLVFLSLVYHPVDFLTDLILHLLVLHGGFHLEAVGFESILCLDPVAMSFILGLVFLSLVYHPVDFLLGQTSLVVGNGDSLGFTGASINSGDVENTVSVNIKGNLDLGNSSWCRWDTGQLELSEDVVILGQSSLTLVHLDKYTGLVVGVGGELLAL